MNCIKTSSKFDLIVNIGIHVVILFTILSLFFTLYVYKIQKHVTEEHLGKLVENAIIDYINKNLKNDGKVINDKIKQYMNEQLLKQYQEIKIMSDTSNLDIDAYLQQIPQNDMKQLYEQAKNKFDVNIFDPNTIINILKNIPSEQIEKIYGISKNETSINNNWLIKFTFTINGLLILFIIAILLVLYFEGKRCTPILHILKENIMVFMCVAIVEILFFKFVAIKFVPAPPSYLINSVIDNIKNNLKNN
jgi:hypothetical protein